MAKQKFADIRGRQLLAGTLTTMVHSILLTVKATESKILLWTI